LIWVYDAGVPNVPDLDNIVKPFIDVPQDVLYPGDSLFREIQLFKFELNEPRSVDVSSEKLNAALASRQEFVYIRINAMRSGAVRSLTLPAG